VARHREAILAAAEKHHLDPLLICAVIDQESGGGVYLDARGKGDGGHGHGLMQIDSRWHREFIDTQPWGEPAVNIDYGAGLLASYIRQLGGAVDAGVCAYNAGPKRAREALQRAESDEPKERLRRLNYVTARGNYVSRVLTRLERWRAVQAKAKGT
jgi:soluble lytic murein transglycosylase-like protein